jgi:hypothetical protein
MTDTTSTIECGYCSATVRVNESSGEVRERKRPLAGRNVRCIGGGQPAFIYPGNLQAGDEYQTVGDSARRVVDAKPTVPKDSDVWEVPADRAVLHRLRGNVLLRLWTRQAGER